VKSLLRVKSYQDDIMKHLQEIAAKNARLEELEKIRDGLAHMIVHDMRNPLTGIQTFLELALMDTQNLAAAQKERIELGLHLCWELNRMIQNLLDIGKMEEGKLQLNCETTAVPDLIREVLNRFALTAKMTKVALSFSAKGDLPSAAVDRSIVTRVITNLVDNAIRYSPTDAEISIGLEFVPEERALCLSVQDSGRGLPAEYHKKIFDKFEQVRLKEEGDRAGNSGLGLSFCKMAVEAHGGKIWVESEGLGKGCTFKTLIPQSPREGTA
jgi:two-component system, sensor histidine kinase and response regulator